MNILSSSVFSGKDNLEEAYKMLSDIGILSIYQQLYPSGTVGKIAPNNEVMVQCPHSHNHKNGDKNPSCSLNIAKNTYCCFGCGASGNVYDLASQLTGKTGKSLYDAVLHQVPYPKLSCIPAVTNSNVKTHNNVRVIYYYYSEILRVVRTETYSDSTFTERINKTFRTEYSANGKWNTFYSHSKSLIDDLGIQLDTAIYGDTKASVIVVNEGEKCVDIFRSYGIPACCLHSTHKLKPLAALHLLKELNPNLMIILAIDNDTTGDKFLEVYGDALRQLDISYRVIKWKDCNVPAGGDIAEFIEGKTKEDLLKVLEDACQQPAGLYLGNQQPAKSQKTDAITQINEIADSLVGASDSDIAAAILRFHLDRIQSDFLVKLITEKKLLATASTLLEHAVAVPEIPIELILPKCKLNSLLTDFGKNLQVPGASILMAFLTTVSSRCTVGTSLTLRKSSNHSVIPFLYTVLVGPPGSGKTPLLNAITTAPCRILQSKLNADFQSKLSQYEADLRFFNSTKEKNPDYEMPTPPVKKAAYVSDATTEAVIRMMEENPSDPVFLLVDELASLIFNRGKYSKGKNSDAQFYNSAYSGQIPVVARKTTGIMGSGSGGVAILGGTQPSILQSLFSSSSPDSGEWARYCFANIPSVIRTIDCEDDSDVVVDFSEYLADVYQKVSDYGSRHYSLSKDAYRLWGTKSNEFNQKVTKCHQPYLQHVYAKSSEILGRFALVLHLAQSALLEIEPPSQVAIETMSKAVLLTEYYIATSAKAYSDMDLETQLFNSLVEMLKSNGTVTYASFCTRYNGAKRKMIESQFNIWVKIIEQQGLAVKKKARNGFTLTYQEQSAAPIQEQLKKQEQLPAPIQEQEQPVQLPAPIEQPLIQEQVQRPPALIQEPLIQEQVQRPPAPIEQPLIQEQVQRPPAPIQEQEQPVQQQVQQPLVKEQSAPIEQQQPLQQRKKIPTNISDVKIKYYQDTEKYVIDYQKDGNLLTFDYFPVSIEEVLAYLPDYFGDTECLIYSASDSQAIAESYVPGAVVKDFWVKQLCSWFNTKKNMRSPN